MKRHKFFFNNPLNRKCKNLENKGSSLPRTVVSYPSNQAQTIESLREWIINLTAIQGYVQV